MSIYFRLYNYNYIFQYYIVCYNLLISCLFLDQYIQVIYPGIEQVCVKDRFRKERKLVSLEISSVQFEHVYRKLPNDEISNYQAFSYLKLNLITLDSEQKRSYELPRRNPRNLGSECKANRTNERSHACEWSG